MSVWDLEILDGFYGFLSKIEKTTGPSIPETQDGPHPTWGEASLGRAGETGIRLGWLGIRAVNTRGGAVWRSIQMSDR